MRPTVHIILATFTTIIGLLLIILTPSYFGNDVDLLSWIASLILIVNLPIVWKASKHKEDQRLYKALHFYVLANLFAIGTIASWHYTGVHSDTVARLEVIFVEYASAPFWNLSGNALSIVCASSALLMLIFEAIGIWQMYSKKKRS